MATAALLNPRRLTRPRAGRPLDHQPSGSRPRPCAAQLLRGV